MEYETRVMQVATVWKNDEAQILAEGVGKMFVNREKAYSVFTVE